jgi:hypothetical protein
MWDTGFGGFGLTGYEIYEQMTSGPQEHSLNGASQGSWAESQKEAERAKRIEQLARKIAAGWQGAAAEGAQGAAGPLAKVALEASELQKVSQRVLEEQSHTFRAAAGNLKKIDPQPPSSNIIDDFTPWDTDNEKKIKQYQQDAQHNIDIYGRYDNQSFMNEGRFPQTYPSIVDPGGNVGVKPPGSEPQWPPGGGGRPPIESGHGVGGGSHSGGELQQVGTWQPPQGTHTSVADPVGTAERPPSRVPVQPPGTLPPQQPGPGWTPVGAGPFGGGRGSWTGGGDGSSRFGGRGGEGASGRGGTSGGEGRSGGGASEGTGRGTGAGARGGAGGEHGAGGRAGAGGMAAEEAAGRRGLAGGGRGGAGGMGGGGMGAGRGQGGEDDEHERKSFLQEPDPEAIFGSDEMTAPPVIGE